MKTIAEQIAQQISLDIRYRSGLSQAWDDLSSDDKDEARQDWARIIADLSSRKHL